MIVAGAMTGGGGRDRSVNSKSSWWKKHYLENVLVN